MRRKFSENTKTVSRAWVGRRLENQPIRKNHNGKVIIII
jgi:hypothetical protein